MPSSIRKLRDRSKKQTHIEFTNLLAGEKGGDSYDKLVIATGASAANHLYPELNLKE